METKKDPKNNLNGNLKQLAEITAWFDNQKEVDVEEGLKKVKEAVSLIKSSRERLKAVENEFEEIKKEIDLEEENASDGKEAEF
jgi:exonuclease VII small subunit